MTQHPVVAAVVDNDTAGPGHILHTMSGASTMNDNDDLSSSSLHSFLGKLLRKHDVQSSSVTIVNDNAALSLETRIWASASFCSDNNNKGISRWSSTPEITTSNIRRTVSSSLRASAGGRRSFLGCSVGSVQDRNNATWDKVPVAPQSSSSSSSNLPFSKVVTSSVHNLPFSSTTTNILTSSVGTADFNIMLSSRPPSLVMTSSSSSSDASSLAPRLPYRNESPSLKGGKPIRTIDLDHLDGHITSSLSICPTSLHHAESLSTSTNDDIDKERGETVAHLTSVRSSPTLLQPETSAGRSSSVPTIPVLSAASAGSDISKTKMVTTPGTSTNTLKTNSTRVKSKNKIPRSTIQSRNTDSGNTDGSSSIGMMSKLSSSSSTETKESERRLRNALGSMAPAVSRSRKLVL